MLIHLAVVFLSSFLLFQVQPLIGKQILPWFGGSPAVWTTCMLFFQVVLLAGYGYAHLVTMAPRRKQGYIHLTMLALALLFLPIAPSPGFWKPSPADRPVLDILLLLLANIGMPYLVLSATAPLLQHWFVLAFPGRSPYRLYALSNAASLLALLSYPLLVEPGFTLKNQVLFWSWGFGVYAVTAGWAALYNRPGEGQTLPDGAPGSLSGEKTGYPPRGAMFLWLILSACGSALLLATTNQICQEVAVVPFLWVLPLALYLITFIICFNSDRAYDRVLWGLLMIAALIPACRILYLGVYANLTVQVLIFLGALFTCCMVCHGELVRSRPAPVHLTVYYLIISGGGALGGLLVGIVAPALFRGFWEYPIALACSCLVILYTWYRGGAFDQSPRWLPVMLVLGELVLIIFTARYLTYYNPDTIASSRNFYGVLRVIRDRDPSGPKLALMHGRVAHGTQFIDPEKRRLPTTYYGPESAAGLALTLEPRRKSGSLKVGVIGLGTGTLAAYGRKGDLFRFYEINPEVITLANKHFTYLKDSAATVETVLGDARITLERELQSGSLQYDILLVDAFSSDAIPVHLLSRECFALYRQHLKPNGLLLVHITNRFLDLEPVLMAQGEAAHLRTALLASDGNQKIGTGKARWMILDSGSGFLDLPEIRAKLAPRSTTGLSGRLWTDDYASLWQILKK